MVVVRKLLLFQSTLLLLLPAFHSAGAQLHPGINATAVSAQVQQTPDTTKLNVLAQQAASQSSVQDQQIADLQKQLEAVQSQLAQNNNAASTIQTLTARITALETAQKTQQDLAATQAKKATDDLTRQYQAGYAGLSLMDDQAHRLEFAFNLGSAISDFQDAVNPMNNQLFTTDVQALLQKQNTNVISSLTSNPLVKSVATANPYVSLGLSLASYFTSKVSDKDQKLTDIACVVNLGTQSLTATQQIQAQLTSVQANIKQFEATSDSTFQGYAGVIGYNKNLDQYRADQLQAATDILAPSVANAFKDGGNAISTAGIVNTRYQLGQLRTQLAQYDSLVQNVSDFLTKFGAILSDQQKAFAGATCASTANDKLKQLQQTVADLKPAFDQGHWAISASQRALMEGTPVQ
ncbi:hypothetical protein [Edaphobacter dinghuensis]|uniref:Uncharacterized protein n=1 Tax=Edaphobacter dinghuensis TaxID=1560005 RepID=A0A917H4L0_9BACT|nr:hypothetical protein [Edaphobacter dinghuensis]GGG66864.1 hypothetical protein GCM10011585_05910 [Edaphobacter dinghuensis]